MNVVILVFEFLKRFYYYPVLTNITTALDKRYLYLVRLFFVFLAVVICVTYPFLVSIECLYGFHGLKFAFVRVSEMVYTTDHGTIRVRASVEKNEKPFNKLGFIFFQTIVVYTR